MKYLWILCLLYLSCSDNKKEYEGIPSEFKNISYITTTNENTNGGSQFAYLSSGLLQDGVAYCFVCQNVQDLVKPFFHYSTMMVQTF